MLAAINQRNINEDDYPFNIVSFDKINLEYPVVFFTGSNGSGKSTILNAIANLSNSISLGKEAFKYDYNKAYSLSFSQKLKRGYYFTSEDFYTYLIWAKKDYQVNQEMLSEASARHTNKEGLGYILETNLHKNNSAALNSIVDNYLKVSHGEGYIDFFKSRLRANTLYLLDEPETPLSFQNQLSLLALIDEYTKLGSQFIICTHSPILLAYPNAKIYYFEDGVESLEYSDHPIVKDYKYFLDSPDRFMYHLLKSEKND